FLSPSLPRSSRARLVPYTTLFRSNGLARRSWRASLSTGPAGWRTWSRQSVFWPTTGPATSPEPSFPWTVAPVWVTETHRSRSLRPFTTRTITQSDTWMNRLHGHGQKGVRRHGVHFSFSSPGPSEKIPPSADVRDQLLRNTDSRRLTFPARTSEEVMYHVDPNKGEPCQQNSVGTGHHRPCIHRNPRLNTDPAGTLPSHRSPDGADPGVISGGLTGRRRERGLHSLGGRRTRDRRGQECLLGQFQQSRDRQRVVLGKK